MARKKPPPKNRDPRWRSDAEPAPGDLWEPRAATVGQLAWRDYQSGKRDDLWKLVPNYHRQSAAEEKWEQRNAAAPQQDHEGRQR